MIHYNILRNYVASGLSNVEIARRLGVSRERVRQIVSEHNLEVLRTIPHDYISIREYAMKYHLLSHVLLYYCSIGRLESVKIRARRYIKDEPRKCIYCKEEPVDRSHWSCPKCKTRHSNNRHWRSFYHRTGREIPHTIQYVYRKDRE